MHFYKYTLLIFLGLFLFNTAIIFAQEKAINDSNKETSIAENEKLEVADEVIPEKRNENLSIEEYRQLEKESKAKEKEYQKESREALRLERQIERTKRAETRAQKARIEADDQAEKTKKAIESYLEDF